MEPAYHYNSFKPFWNYKIFKCNMIFLKLFLMLVDNEKQVIIEEWKNIEDIVCYK